MSGVRLMGLWAKTSPDGKTYHEGKLGGALVRIFTNDYRKSERDPDIVVYVSQPPKDAQRASAPAAPQRAKPKITPRPQAQGNVAPQRTAYKDHTAASEGPPPDDSPWPTDDEGLPF